MENAKLNSNGVSNAQITVTTCFSKGRNKMETNHSWYNCLGLNGMFSSNGKKLILCALRIEQFSIVFCVDA